MLDLLRTRSAELDRRIAELRTLRGELNRLVARAEALDPADCDPGRICHLVGPTGVAIVAARRTLRPAMFERFDQPATEVIKAAITEAAELGDDALGTEHLLLALATGDAVTASAPASPSTAHGGRPDRRSPSGAIPPSGRDGNSDPPPPPPRHHLLTLHLGSGFTVDRMDGLRISELADRAAVSTSTLRYYERIGLVPAPRRSPAGYRLYGADAEARLLLITRGKLLGLSLEEIADLLAIWDGANCGPTQERLSALLAAKQAEIRKQIQDLERFALQLADVETRLAGAPAVDGCAPDLACCAPGLPDATVSVTPRGPDRQVASPATAERPPIACTLTPVDRPARRAEMKLLAPHVASWTRREHGLRLRFPLLPDVEAQLRELVAREQQCCAFLSFTLEKVGGEWCLDIEAPDPETTPALDEFMPLLAPERESRSA